jgi:hypothetical protein
MPAEFFIFLATVCFQAQGDATMKKWHPDRQPGYAEIGSTFEDCVLEARISVSSKTLPGETMFRGFHPAIPWCAAANETCGRYLKFCRIEYLWESHKKEEHNGEFGIPCDMCKYWCWRTEELIEEEQKFNSKK